MRKQLILFAGLLIHLGAIGQIKTTEVEVRNTSSTVINDIIGPTKLYGTFNVEQTPNNFLNVNPTINFTSSGEFYRRAIRASTMNMFNIPAGVTDNGYRQGIDINAYVNTPNFAGTLNNLHGMRIQVGHHSAATGGTINNAYGLIISGLENGGTSITNTYGIYQSGRLFRNYFQGNVGLGNSNPQSRLMVSTDNFQLDGVQGVLIGGGAIANGNYTPAVGFSNSAASMDAAISGVQEGSDNNAMGLAFFVHSSSTASDPKEEAMRISRYGNIGIGTTSPAGKLHINSSTAALGGGLNQNYDNVIIEGDNNVGLTLKASTVNNVGIAFGDSEDNDRGRILYRNNSDRMSFFVTGAERLSIADNNVGIGTTSPNVALVVSRGSNLSSLSSENGDFQIGTYTGAHMSFDTNEIQVATGDVPGNLLFQKHGGNIGVGTNSPSEKLHVNGNVLANNVSVSSDRRWKKNINTIEEASATLYNINPVSYELRKDEFPEKDFDELVHYGVIAQELEQVLPELVSTDQEGFKSVDYQGMIGLLVKGFQERGEEIKRLKQALAEKDEVLEARLARIEKALSIDARDHNSDELSTSEQ